MVASEGKKLNVKLNLNGIGARHKSINERCCCFDRYLKSREEVNANARDIEKYDAQKFQLCEQKTSINKCTGSCATSNRVKSGERKIA